MLYKGVRKTHTNTNMQQNDRDFTTVMWLMNSSDVNAMCHPRPKELQGSVQEIPSLTKDTTYTVHVSSVFFNV